MASATGLSKSSASSQSGEREKAMGVASMGNSLAWLRISGKHVALRYGHAAIVVCEHPGGNKTAGADDDGAGTQMLHGALSLVFRAQLARPTSSRCEPAGE